MLLAVKLVANSLAFSRRENDTKIADKAFKMVNTVKMQIETHVLLKNIDFYEALTLDSGINIGLRLGTIQVLRHQRGGWVGSENGNF